MGKQHSCWKILENAGIDTTDREIIVRREISQEGNNRAYINSQLVPLSLVLRLGGQLVDIHGQHAQQDLLTPSSHLGFLDQCADIGFLLNQYSDKYQTLKELEKKLSLQDDTERNRLQRMDFLNYQIKEIQQLELDPEADGVAGGRKISTGQCGKPANPQQFGI